MNLSPDAKAIFHAMTEGVTIIDTAGRVVFANHAYRSFLNQEAGHDIGEIEGRLLRDLRPSARLPDVLKTGTPILHLTRKEIAEFYFVNMYPIYVEGKLVGGCSIVTFLDHAYRTKEELDAMELRNRQLLHRINKANGARYTFQDIVAVSPLSEQVKALAEKISATDATVLLESESGTGKELYAQAIHNHSPRRQGIFVAINCSNFTKNMLESELFGYAEGAFTGAKKGGKIGLFEAADGGTLLLDEISELDLSLQAKLLRVLQERRIRPVGSVREVEIDVRIIAACNASLSDYVQSGRFRKDLYYRLNTFPLQIPPLRERTEDIPSLAYTILAEFSRKLRRPITITAEAIDCLQSHDWPGNVRELRNVLEFCAYLVPGGTITPEDLPNHLGNAAAPRGLTLAERTRAFQRREILALLEKYGDNLDGKRRAACQLGISLSGLYAKLAE